MWCMKLFATASRSDSERTTFSATLGCALALVIIAPRIQAETVTYVYADQQGTPLALANSSGTITAQFDYRPYGALAMGSPIAAPGYTGHVVDPDINLVYMQARYFDPDIGRFLSVDHTGVSAGDLYAFSRYAYGDNNPINRIDPDGNNSIIVHHKDGSISIKIPIIFSGPAAADASKVQGTKDQIHDRWTHDYNVDGKTVAVDVSVVAVDENTPRKVTNKILLLNGKTDIDDGTSYVNPTTYRSGQWDTTSIGWEDGEAAHEAGHLMRIDKDKYVEDGKDANGKRKTKVLPEYSKDLMGQLGKNQETSDKDMQEILMNRNNVQETDR